MSINLVDTTLRDGEQQPGLALGIKAKVTIARILDKLGVYQIEAGIPAMGGSEKKSIQIIAQSGLTSKISTWNRMEMADIRQALECHADIIHISVPVSHLQMRLKLRKNEAWVLDNMRRCVSYATEKGATVTLGLEDASRADTEFLLKIADSAAAEGVTRIRYADTVGIAHRKKVIQDIGLLCKNTPIPLEFHAHNDLGMAVSNSLAAVQAGAAYIDCTIGGLGERAGNCNFLNFIKASQQCLGLFTTLDLTWLAAGQQEILSLIKVRSAV